MCTSSCVHNEMSDCRLNLTAWQASSILCHQRLSLPARPRQNMQDNEKVSVRACLIFLGLKLLLRGDDRDKGESASPWPRSCFPFTGTLGNQVRGHCNRRHARKQNHVMRRKSCWAEARPVDQIPSKPNTQPLKQRLTAQQQQDKVAERHCLI